MFLRAARSGRVTEPFWWRIGTVGPPVWFSFHMARLETFLQVERG